jgi:hypothetical protein
MWVVVWRVAYLDVRGRGVCAIREVRVILSS